MRWPAMTGGGERAAWSETADEPTLTAAQARRRWLYIFAVTAAAGIGRMVDATLAQVVTDACKSREMALLEKDPG